ncbi:MAG: amidohydrolase family protein [Planctomycetes bacterium]|nr:amidohydrolase family protein [Planctomycetota bacterium]
MNMHRIDAHAHLAFDPSCGEMMEFVESMNLRIINTSGNIAPGWHDQGRIPAYRNLAACRPDLFAWITGFDLPEFDNPNYHKRMLAQLKDDFAQNAAGCKLWRQIGMTVRKPSGEYMLMDDAILDPIYECLVECGRPLLVHISEPQARWPQARGRKIGFYGRQPAHRPLEDEYGDVDFPPAAEQIAAQGRVLAKYPELKVIGAHFGGMEHDIRELAKFLDEHPNFAVDTSARRRDVALQALNDRDAVREFFRKYKSRILWGMDQGTGAVILNSKTRADTIKDSIKANRDGYEYEFSLYEKEGMVKVDQYDDIPGLGLGDDVLRAIYHDNARTWYPHAFRD